MRAFAKILFILSLLACFAVAIPACGILANNKDLCIAASSLCTWTDEPAKNSCEDACPLYPKVDTDCTSNQGCQFIPSTCYQKNLCYGQGKDTCTAANNCVYKTQSCSVNPTASQICSIGNSCIDPLPAYCTKTITLSCSPSGAITNTCPRGVVSPSACFSPCSTATLVTSCTSICAGLTQTDCLAASTNCSWANGSCGIKVGLADCSTVTSSNCAANPQCVTRIAYNCSTTASSLISFCATAGTPCLPSQAGWCSTIYTNTCAVNINYCVLGMNGNGCDIDSTNCITTASCSTLDAKACTYSSSCNENFCNFSEASCINQVPGSCKLNGSACTPDDSSCQFRAGGTCTVSTTEKKIHKNEQFLQK